ncbi:MerR family transcriptional regulator [Iodidimonas sp. MBR-22]|uniref:MerR family transcriptional regulator n=1 Tax=unclassified Iodidimonas TaxID=2626145 RepID=UPI0032B1511C
MARSGSLDTGESGSEKSDRAFRTIGEVSELLDLPQHVLRFWETRFTSIRPMKRGGNRRYYRPQDIALLRTVKHLLHEDGMTIKGVQKRFREQGVKATIDDVMAVAEPDGLDRGSIDRPMEGAGAGQAPSAGSKPDQNKPDADGAGLHHIEDMSDDQPIEPPLAEPGRAEKAPMRATLAHILDELRTLRQMLD